MSDKKKLIWIEVNSAKKAQQMARRFDEQGPAYKEPAKMSRTLRDIHLANAKKIKREWL